MIVRNRINELIISVLLFSISLLVLVFYFEYGLGLIPCKLCIWQRVPHTAVILICLTILIKNKFKLLGSIISLIATIAGFVLSGYHLGVEHKIWQGPNSCSDKSALTTLSPDLFLETILKAPIIRCDEITWTFLKISMAGWNFLLSLILAHIWLLIIFLIMKSSKN